MPIDRSLKFCKIFRNFIALILRSYVVQCILPRFDYASVIWSPCKVSDKNETVGIFFFQFRPNLMFKVEQNNRKKRIQHQVFIVKASIFRFIVVSVVRKIFQHFDIMCDNLQHLEEDRKSKNILKQNERWISKTELSYCCTILYFFFFFLQNYDSLKINEDHFNFTFSCSDLYAALLFLFFYGVEYPRVGF